MKYKLMKFYIDISDSINVYILINGKKFLC